MKILIVKNRLTVEVQDDVLNAFSWLEHKTPIKFEISYLETNFDLQYKKFETPEGFYGTTGTKDKLSPLIKEKYDVIIFMYGNSPNDKTPDGHQLAAWTFFEGLNGAEYIEIPCYSLSDKIGWIGRTIQHEMMHHFCKLLNRLGGKVIDKMDTYIENENPDSPTGNYAQTFQTLNLYWNLLNKPMYKYFSQKEVDKFKLEDKLWKVMDTIRELSGIPIVGSSGRRTVQENINAGGKPNSAHLRGLAFDWVCKDNFSRTKYIKAVANCGTPVFLEIAKSHIHLDIDTSIHEMGQTITSEDD